ncbi:hypothetical protein [Magnetospirillum sp. UT-4]|uniref:hypothetical protein n=1 Tax=Magnetospirillum sp. UT-4 TaxID=2681467 RepID=UPI0013837B47|nr:hypothetical protein [Magnetospirillum sp. UT-4]CAA7623710.1 conserved exported hypothetical protein [Magnetospirillum sp. UT-4]
MAFIAASGGLRQRVLILLACLWASAAAAQDCPPRGLAAPMVETLFTSDVVEPVVRNDRTRNQLTQLATRHTAGHREAGLTQTRTQLTITPRYRWTDLPGGRTCLMLERVTADWRMHAITVDIAAEFPPGTCQYNVVREHEFEHVRLTRGAFHAHVPRMRAHLAEVTRGIGPFVFHGDAQRGGEQIIARLKAGLKPVLDDFEADNRRANSAIDTVESYRAVAARCPSW